jgi:hypothetical protein
MGAVNCMERACVRWSTPNRGFVGVMVPLPRTTRLVCTNPTADREADGGEDGANHEQDLKGRDGRGGARGGRDRGR